jgi:pimeloyl-ACP methyl ester carboxylesterase
MPELVTIHNGEWPLSGVVHAPRSRPQQRRLGVILLHENFNTKFGTHRIFYELGETLADNGLYALRYDDRGTCDSPRIHPLTFLDRVDDACTASNFFMNKYELDSVLFWGLCMGAAVAVHASERLAPERPRGMMLCSILADPLDASLPQFGYSQVNVSRFIEQRLLRGGAWQRAFRFVTDRSYRQNAVKLVKQLVMRYSTRAPELGQLQSDIARVRDLLCRYNGPIVFVFGDRDDFLSTFLNRINVDDRLGLATRESERTLLLLEGADHTFSVRRHTEILISWTVAWAESLRDGTLAQFDRSTAALSRGIPATESSGGWNDGSGLVTRR